jgi:membrane-associated phospholipid phosphatase
MRHASDSASGRPSRRLVRELAWSRVRLLRSPWRLAALFCGILLPLGLAAELAEDVLDREELRLDGPLLLWLHARSSPELDRLFLLITEAGGFLGTSFVAMAFGWRLWCLRRRRALLFWGLSMFGAGALNVAIKLFFRRDRPSLWPSISPEKDFSFPSGHAMLSVSLAAAVILLAWPTRWRWHALASGVAWPLLVGVSRLYLGVHFPSDVLVGWCAGLAWTVGVYFVLRGERDGFLQRVAPVDSGDLPTPEEPFPEPSGQSRNLNS